MSDKKNNQGICIFTSGDFEKNVLSRRRYKKRNLCLQGRNDYLKRQNKAFAEHLKKMKSILKGQKKFLATKIFSELLEEGNACAFISTNHEKIFELLESTIEKTVTVDHDLTDLETSSDSESEKENFFPETSKK